MRAISAVIICPNLNQSYEALICFKDVAPNNFGYFPLVKTPILEEQEQTFQNYLTDLLDDNVEVGDYIDTIETFSKKGNGREVIDYYVCRLLRSEDKPHLNQFQWLPTYRVQALLENENRLEECEILKNSLRRCITWK